VSFGEIDLLSSTLKSLKVLIRFSNELLRQSVIGLDATLNCASSPTCQTPSTTRC
jgi:hypothetical protein